MAKKPIRRYSLRVRTIFLIDSEGIFDKAFIRTINAEKDLTVCGMAKNLNEAFRDASRLQLDLVVANVALPDKNTFGLAKKLREKYSNSKIRLLVVSRHADSGNANRALRAGADGYISQDEDTEEIICAMRDVLSGHIYVSEKIMAQASNISTNSSRAEKHAKALLKIDRRTARSARTRDRVNLMKARNQSAQGSDPDWKSTIAI